MTEGDVERSDAPMDDWREKPGFKLTTPANWREPDPLMALLVKRDHRDGAIYPVDGSDWIEYVAHRPLSASVPKDVWLAYHFAVGATGYAYYYFPLFTVVAQQVLRVADFAIDKLFETLGKKNVRSLARRLKILFDEGYITQAEFFRWDAIRELRNKATHPAWQENWGHSMSLDIIVIVSEAISGLPWPTDTAN